MPLKHQHHNNLNTFYGIRRNSGYAGLKRNFSYSSRSEETVVAKSIKALVAYRQKSCEVPQSDKNLARSKNLGLKLFKLYEKRINLMFLQFESYVSIPSIRSFYFFFLSDGARSAVERSLAMCGWQLVQYFIVCGLF